MLSALPQTVHLLKAWVGSFMSFFLFGFFEVQHGVFHLENFGSQRGFYTHKTPSLVFDLFSGRCPEEQGQLQTVQLNFVITPLGHLHLRWVSKEETTGAGAPSSVCL